MRLCPTYLQDGIANFDKAHDYHDSWFLALGFPQGVSDAQFCRISRECKLSGIFKGKKVANLKIPGFFSEKYILNRSPTPPPRFFSGIAHC